MEDFDHGCGVAAPGIFERDITQQIRFLTVVRNLVFLSQLGTLRPSHPSRSPLEAPCAGIAGESPHFTQAQVDFSGEFNEAQLVNAPHGFRSFHPGSESPKPLGFAQSARASRLRDHHSCCTRAARVLHQLCAAAHGRAACHSIRPMLLQR